MSGATLQSEKTKEVLTAKDRCSASCAAQAYIKVETLEMGDFTFCMHHWQVKHPVSGKSNKEILEPLSINVIDESHRLLPQPYDPATDNS